MAQAILALSDVTKKIKSKEIIKGISFEVQAGEVLGFLGPNGAGKSTTLRMIVGLSKPTSGQIMIGGYDITKHYVQAMSQVGCIIEGPDLYNNISGYKNMEMLASMSRGVTAKDIMDAVELVGMTQRIHDKVGIYSMGMKQRLGLAQALIHRPSLLILDEPTNGLDPQGIHEFREIIKNLAEEKNISVVISSHLISEVQLMCDNVSIIHKGLIIKNANVDDLLTTGEVQWTLERPEEAMVILRDRFQINSRLVKGQLEAIIEVEKLPAINQTFFQEGIPITYVSTKNKTLEELFLGLTEDQKIN